MFHNKVHINYKGMTLLVDKLHKQEWHSINIHKAMCYVSHSHPYIHVSSDKADATLFIATYVGMVV